MMARIDQYALKLGEVLEGTVTATLAQAEDANVALLYSAGVDSAVLAKVCQDAGYSPLLLSLGTDRSKDREFVERSRPYLDLCIQFITVGEEDIARALPAVQNLLQKAEIALNLMHLSLGVGTYLACQVARQQGIRLLLTAQGADALFAGFHKYRSVPLEELPAVLERDARNALRTDFVRDRTIAAAFSIEFAAPFLAPRVADLVLTIPVEFKLGPAGNKLVLRELARQRGLPEFLAQRPKKAMQYSTGIQRVVQQLQKTG